MTEHPILVGIDGSASGLEALALGSAFAVLTGSPLVLGAVYGYAGGSFAGGMVWPPKDDAERWLEDASDRLGDAIPWRARTILSTSPPRGLIEIAEHEGARMVVVGSSHHGPIGRVLAGTTARGVVHGAPCAVAVVPHDWHTQPPEVALTYGAAVDESPESRDALALAAELAAAGDAPLRVVTAVHVAPPAHPMYAAFGTRYPEWRQQRLEDGERLAREAVDAVAPDAEAQFRVFEGDPVDRLVEASRDLDLLVVGSRRYGPLRRALLGGVSAALIERAACPVVIVPRGAHAEGNPPQPAAGGARLERSGAS